MKALVYRGPGFKALEDRPKPVIVKPDDAIVKITKTTICGTDLHILKGDVPTCAPGRILGHEGTGVVETVGPTVTAFKPGAARTTLESSARPISRMLSGMRPVFLCAYSSANTACATAA